MTIIQLRDQLNDLIETLENQGNIKQQGAETTEIPVEILLEEESIGPAATTGIKLATLGFDWDAGKFLIIPKDDLIRKSAGRLGARKVNSRDCVSCGSCGTIVGKGDRFCKHCGRKFLD